ncbi:MAG: serine/threonine-protein kinase [Chthoniobacteraceae bacterium]|nr:serine/threonine-protein kinase [Chthoniobacteraceae bacterium]
MTPLFPQLEILEFIGQGGMGAVYKARQRELDRVVALKILPPGIGDAPAFAERFAREAKALAKLNHPGIVTIHDFGRTDGLYYFLMEYVDGVNLRQLLQNGRVSAREALAIVPQICDALQFAHDHGIVHRDIKPENILMDRLGRVKVADFGLAKLVGAENEAVQATGATADSPDLTEAGKIMGTPQYMSPEQIQTPGEVDHRADIFALGVVFYQMLTGELPGKQIEPPSKKVRIDVRLDEVVLRALERNPALRYQQASILKTQVETIAGTETAHSSAPKEQSGVPFLNFQSKLAAKCWAYAWLGGFAGLGLIPGWEICYGFGLFFGLFGLAVIMEMWHRGRPESKDISVESPISHVRGPAIGLFVTGILNWVSLPAGLLIGLPYILKYLRDSGSNVIPLYFAVAVMLASASLMLAAGLKMQRLESYRLSVTASLFAILISPGNVIGLPIGIWALVVLARPEVRQAFKARTKSQESIAPVSRVQSPGWRLLIAIIVSALAILLTSLVIHKWLGLDQQTQKPSPSSQTDPRAAYPRNP